MPGRTEGRGIAGKGPGGREAHPERCFVLVGDGGGRRTAEALRRASAGGEEEKRRHGRFSELLFDSSDEELADIEAERLAVVDLLRGLSIDGGERRPAAASAGSMGCSY